MRHPKDRVKVYDLWFSDRNGDFSFSHQCYSARSADTYIGMIENGRGCKYLREVREIVDDGEIWMLFPNTWNITQDQVN